MTYNSPLVHSSSLPVTRSITHLCCDAFNNSPVPVADMYFDPFHNSPYLLTAGGAGLGDGRERGRGLVLYPGRREGDAVGVGADLHGGHHQGGHRTRHAGQVSRALHLPPDRDSYDGTKLDVHFPSAVLVKRAADADYNELILPLRQTSDLPPKVRQAESISPLSLPFSWRCARACVRVCACVCVSYGHPPSTTSPPSCSSPGVTLPSYGPPPLSATTSPPPFCFPVPPNTLATTRQASVLVTLTVPHKATSHPTRTELTEVSLLQCPVMPPEGQRNKRSSC